MRSAGGTKSAAALRRHLRDEVGDGFLDRAVIPGGQGIGLRLCLSRGHGEHKQNRRCKPDRKTECVHSITSSARASNGVGTLIPIASAVFRLMISAVLVDSCTGMSAGFSPFRMRPA